MAQLQAVKEFALVAGDLKVDELLAAHRDEEGIAVAEILLGQLAVVGAVALHIKHSARRLKACRDPDGTFGRCRDPEELPAVADLTGAALDQDRRADKAR